MRLRSFIPTLSCILGLSIGSAEDKLSLWRSFFLRSCFSFPLSSCVEAFESCSGLICIYLVSGCTDFISEAALVLWFPPCILLRASLAFCRCFFVSFSLSFRIVPLLICCACLLIDVELVIGPPPITRSSVVATLILLTLGKRVLTFD